MQLGHGSVAGGLCERQLKQRGGIGALGSDCREGLEAVGTVPCATESTPAASSRSGVCTVEVVLANGNSSES